MGADSGPPLNTGRAPERGLIRNSMSLIGAAIAVVALANILFLFLVDIISNQPNPYLGIVAYMVAPACLIFGLLLVAIGVLRERARRRRGLAGAIPRFPRLDLNDPAQRSTVAFVLTFIVIFVMLSVVGSYKAYEFTDSVEFCGQLCHRVMNPEFTAYSLSPHARVRCVDCHVGAGATWYAKSKLSGAYQVYATLFHKYPQPIPTPVANLRPAQQTCEQCHWPRQFYGAQYKAITHYMPDEQNTPLQVRMMINTGGGDPVLRQPTGIHWHMNIGNEITYLATDPQRQVIPWVRIRNLATNQVTEYVAKDASLTPAQIAAAPKRRMDCIDCHDRPTHIYLPPDRSVDQSLSAGRIDMKLPFIKQQAVNALAGKTYNGDAEAAQGIAGDLTSFYSSKYPDIYNQRRAAVDGAILEVQRIYRTSIFPYMKVDWRTHPDNIGHYYFPGCFRCHDNNHVSADGKVISKSCTACHTILGEETGEAAVAGTIVGSGFKHPVDIGDLSAVNCMDCHTGAAQ